MPKITPFLWFDNQAEEAANFYTSIFKNSEIKSVSRVVESDSGLKGKAMSVTFLLDGREITALNGGPVFKFNEAVSFFVHCETQQEVDEYWERLGEGGQAGQCGWLKDKYGLSWQIVPNVLGELLADKDTAKANRVMQAMLKMSKLDIAALKRAYSA